MWIEKYLKNNNFMDGCDHADQISVWPLKY